jgi:hypothetical protein
MATPTGTGESQNPSPRVYRVGAPMLFFAAVIVLLCYRFLLPHYEPPTPAPVARVTTDDGKTATVPDAIAKGWIKAETTRAEKGMDAISFVNNTSRNMQIHFENKTTDIRPQQTKSVHAKNPQQVLTPQTPAETAPPSSPSQTQVLMQSVITLVLLLPSLVVIMKKDYDASQKHWAYGTIGTILGFWLKG